MFGLFGSCDRRNIYRLTLKESGRWVDVEHPDSIAAIGASIGKRLNTELGITQLTLGVLHGENRAATTMVAAWVRRRPSRWHQVPEQTQWR